MAHQTANHAIRTIARWTPGLPGGRTMNIFVKIIRNCHIRPASSRTPNSRESS